MEENPFARIESLKQAEEAIEGRKEFHKIEKEDYVVFNYRFGLAETFPDPSSAKDEAEREKYKLLRELRGPFPLIFAQ